MRMILVLAHAGAPGRVSVSTVVPAVAIVLAGVVYARGVRAAWPPTRDGRRRRVRESLAYVAGLVVLAVALLSPLHDLATALFSAHMVQHLLLTVVAAPLLVLGAPLLPLARGLGVRVGPRRWFAHRLATLGASAPTVAWSAVVLLAHVVVLWTWHAPALYDAAVAHAGLHALEHTTMLVTAVLLWWTIADRARRSVPPLGALAAFITAGQGGLLAALLTFAPRPLYATHAAEWGLTPLEDQQLAGVLMSMPGALPYLAAALVLCLVWLRAAPGEPAR